MINSARLMTGARPTGGLHIGQYFSAFKPFVDSDLQTNSFFILSDLHMLTTKFTVTSTKNLKNSVVGLVAEAIGIGVNTNFTSFYLQSQVPWQARIYAIIQSLAPIQRLLSQKSFEEMSRHASNQDGTSLGLLGYPVLESSDVLSIGATHVTVGESNLGHFDLMRSIVDTLVQDYGVNIRMPQVIVGRRNLIGLDGSNKMSKSAGNAIFLRDSNEAIKDKISQMCLIGEDGANVPVEYLESFGAEENYCQEIKHRLKNVSSMPSFLIDEITERIISLISPIRERAEELLREPEYITSLIKQGCDIACSLGEVAYSDIVKAIPLPRF